MERDTEKVPEWRLGDKSAGLIDSQQASASKHALSGDSAGISRGRDEWKGA